MLGDGEREEKMNGVKVQGERVAVLGVRKKR